MGLDFVNRQGRYIRNEREENYQEDDEIKDILDTGKIVDDEDTYIASYAFAGCSSITSITVSTGAYVGYDAFVNCENIKTVNYVLGSSSVVSSSDFSVPYTVEKITIGKGITDIEEYAFSYMSSLKEVSLPTTLKKIGDSAFYSCSALTEISIPKGVTDIGIWAFGYCTALEKVVIPSTLKSMGSYAFDRCEAIGRVYISDLAAWCKIDFSVGDSEGEIYKGDNPMDYGADLYINKALATDIVIPGGIKKIEGAAFSGCTSMVSLTIPQGVTEIGEWAFLECLNLKYINLPSSLSDVADTAFNRTFAVKHVNYAGTEARWNDVINRDFEYDGATVHYLSDGVIKNKIKKATTSENGYSYYHCSECSAKLSSKKTIAKIKTVKLSTTSYTYNGEVKTPTVTVKDSNGKTLKKDVDYTVNYASGRKYVGKYTVKVTFKGNYSGSKTLSFTIKPAKTGISSLSAGSKRFTAKWSKKTSQTTGYQIQYSRYSSFAKDKIKTISGYKNTSATIKGLSGSKTYYVRIRTYKSVDGKRYYSDWSSAKKVKTKK